MKTINYTGSSKLIARIVSLLNRKAPLPLDGDGDPDWGTNGQFLTTDGAGGTTWSSGGGGGDTVSWTQDVTTGTKIASIDINGNSTDVYAPSGGSGDTVSWTQITTTGTKIAEIDINGTPTDVYAPTSGGSTYTEGDGIDINSSNVISVDTVFTDASTRANIASGDTFATILGKIKKFFTDLKTVAFTGAYSDLSGTPTIPTKTSQLTNDSGYVTTDHTYNFNGDTFWSGDSNDGEHNANNAIKNGHYYYNSNGPATTLGMSSDGALYVQQYNDTWCGQIAQDYRTGNLCVRGKNNGTWQAWKRLIDSGNIGSQSVNYATSAGSATNATNATYATTAYRLSTYWNSYLVTARTGWSVLSLTAPSNVVSVMACPAGRLSNQPQWYVEFSGKTVKLYYKNSVDYSADGYTVWVMC